MMVQSPLPPAPSRRKLPSVQTLRAVAALTVVVHHAGFDADTLADRFGSARLDLDRFFDWTFGIHLFFVISGFIMVRTARGFGTTRAPLRFLARRLERIVPLYWLTTSLVLVGSLAAPSLLNVPVNGSALAFGSYLFVPVARINGEIRPILGQGWTLNYEMAFYVVFAAAMMLPRRLGLASVAAVLIALVVAGRLTRPSSPPLVVWTDTLMLEFLLGVGVGLMDEAGLRLGAVQAAFLGLLSIAAALVAARAADLGATAGAWIANGVPAAMILTACVSGPAWRPGALVLALASLGDASYSLYLTHPIAIRLLRVGWQTLIGTDLPLGLFAALSVSVAVALSLLVYHWLERPMTLALHRRFRTGGRET